jgi:formate-dependent nitrite reductase membrane component NrfD
MDGSAGFRAGGGGNYLRSFFILMPKEKRPDGSGGRYDPPGPRPKATEERLDAIRAEAESTGKVASGAGAGADPATGQHAEMARANTRGDGPSYYNLPVVKPPTWTWEVPMYFFIGGIAGVAAVVALIAQIFSGDPRLVRVALYIAFAGLVLCPVFLISDLGRPSRFLNMLRVFKWRSAMSMGSWILSGFGGCGTLALAAHEMIYYKLQLPLLTPLLPALYWIGLVTGAITGLLLASYTGVLVGATAIPVWHENRRLLPAHFLTGGLGGCSALLELCGFLVPATQFIGFVASSIETLIGAGLELRHRRVDAPLHHGRSGWTMRLAGTLAGPVSLIIRAVWHASATGRHAAAIAFLFGALCTRYAWVWAGRASAHDPQALFETQHAAMARGRKTESPAHG